MPGDDLADHQVHAAQQQHQRGNLAQGAADAAQEHIHHGIGAGEGGEVAVLHHGQGGGGGDGISVGAEGGQLAHGHGPGGHGRGIAGQQSGAARQSGVEEVAADAAVQLLDHHNGEERADDDHPIGQRGGAHKGQQHTGDHGGQVANGLGLFQELAIAPLPEHAGGHGHQRQRQGAEAEYEHAHSQGGDHGDDHVHHDGPGALAGPDVGGGGRDQLQILVIGHGLRLLLFGGGLLGLCLGLGGHSCVVDFLLAHAEGVGQRQTGGAGVGAGAALDAVHAVQGVLPGVHVALHQVLIHEHRLQAHGTYAHALAAADALGMLLILLLVAGEGQHGAGALAHGDVQVVLGQAHHGAAHDQLIGLFLQAAAGVEQLGDGGADGALQVFGLDHAGAGDGDHLADNGHAGVNGLVNGAGGVQVENAAAGVGRQLAGGNLAAGDGLAQLLFSALGIAGMQDLYHHGSLQLGNRLVKHVGRILLVGLDADVHMLHAEALGQQGSALDDLLGPLQHGAVVAGDVGLALGGVDDDIVHLAETGADLHMGGEGRAALAHDTGVFDDLHQLLGGQAVGVVHGMNVRTHGVLEVVLDDHGHHGPAHGEGTGLHCLHRAGHAGMDGSGHETAGFTDLLTDGHLVAHRNDGLAGCTDVHRHGNDHLSRGCQLLDGLFIGRGLHIIGMNAAKESLCHCLHLILLLGGPMPPHTALNSTPDLSSCPPPVFRFSVEFAAFCLILSICGGFERNIYPKLPEIS